MGQEQNSRSIIVTGDLTLSWYLVRQAPDCARLDGEFTGAALLTRLVAAMATRLTSTQANSFLVQGPVLPDQLPRPDDPLFEHKFSYWNHYPEGKNLVWRVAETFGTRACKAPPSNQTINTLSPDLLLIEDLNLGFRDQPDQWPPAITQGPKSPWIVLNMSAPVARGALFENLVERFSQRMIVVMTVDDIRRSEVQISRELSWERTAQDVFWELIHNPRINAISRCAYVVITFGAAGAILLTHDPDTTPTHYCRLIFDSEVIEGMWEAAHPGQLPGAGACLIAGLAVATLEHPYRPDLIQGLQNGLRALRELYLAGYQGGDTTPLSFPLERVSSFLLGQDAPFAEVVVQDPVRFLEKPYPQGEHPPRHAFWTILQDRYKHDLTRLAEQVVLMGPEAALRDIPMGRFGYLLTVDRGEIEAFRSIRTLVGEYCSHLPQKRPLSIAIFGPPGSGKSFGVIQVANALLPGRLQVLEFNLSQFDQVGALWDAMHLVRDVGLSGKIPLVFWDEFDAPLNERPLGWLRYFLAPMQDGSFQDGQLAHPIGSAIFAFAGGTSPRLELFGRDLDAATFRSLKGPDFISRLKGFVDVKGPNRQVEQAEAESDADPYYVIRRAILLHSILKRSAPYLYATVAGKQILNIDPGVLRAFLQTTVYKHGVRSMESIIAMSQLSGKPAYERSCLPSEAQLDLHVDGQDFLSLVQQLNLEPATLEKLAAAVHDVFCEGLHSRGYRWGPETDDVNKTHSSLVAYPELLEYQKEQNRASVRDILSKLDQSGYIMLPARSNEPPFNFPGDDLEMLAELEHQRWVKTMDEDGWQPGTETDKAKRIHRALVPWSELSEADKDKDRDLVRGIPTILARAGYAVQKSSCSGHS